MNRRKLVFVLLAFLAAALCATPASALVTSYYDKACLVPYALADGAGLDTVVGVQIADTSLGGAIYWSFFDANGVPLLSRSIPVTAGIQQYAITLSGAGTGVVLNTLGWILVTWDNDGIQNPGEASFNVAANSFLIDLINSDAAVLPVIPVIPTDFQAVAINLLNPPTGPLVNLFNGAFTPEHGLLVSRFLANSSGDPQTTLVIFSPLDAPLTYDASMINTNGTVQSGIVLPAPNAKLNTFDLADFAPAGFEDAAIRVTNPGALPIGVMFNIIQWSVVGAAQTSPAFED